MVTKKIPATDCATFKKIVRDKKKVLADTQNINYIMNDPPTQTTHFTPQHKH